ncbi:MAG: hypothetical protein CO035_07400, partial [Candidatus Omnitrophica bacterium CG_4_9_14_0_2_um_filter_42_8]
MLLSEGFRDTVLVCGEVAETEGDMMYLAMEKGIKPVIVKELGRELSWRDDWTAFWKIYNIIREVKPDIIHTHTAKAGALGRLAGMFYRLLRFARNDAPVCHCEAVGRSNLVLIHTFHGHVFSGYFGKIKTVFFIWVERFLGLFTDRIITVSENLKKELVEKYRIAPGKKFSVIELGFELDELFKLPQRENNEIVNIGIVGRLVPIKNHKMLFLAVRNLKAKIIVIGNGEMRAELEDYAGELGIQDRVEFRGWVRDLKAIYEGLDIVALTSLNEGTPVSLIEAMAAGRPVVTASVGGVADIVEDGKSGYLVESGNAEEFGRKLMDLIRDPEKRKNFGEYGRIIVK